MRSRAELSLRILGVAAILAWIALALTPRSGGIVVARGSEVGGELERWTRDAAVAAVHVRVDTNPDAVTSAWLAALRRAGTEVTWSGEALSALAIESWPSAEPAGGTMVLVSADSGVLADALGPIDTLRGSAGLQVASFSGALAFTSGNQSARLTESREPRAQSREPNALFIAGTANWEAKFVIAALEEAGWIVDARLVVAPGQEVSQGAARTVEIARHSAVVLLDSTAAESVGGVEAFVRAGGGAVLAGDASRGRRVRELVRWRAGPRVIAPLGTLPGDTLWRGLSRGPLRLASGGAAVTLELRDGVPLVLARRHHAGRVLAAGYDDTWRWRMAGGESSVAAHRAWWSRAVARVAARPPTDVSLPAGAAPVARLHEVMGAPAELTGPGAATLPPQLIGNLLGFLALASLLGEWLLRRSRGAR